MKTKFLFYTLVCIVIWGACNRKDQFYTLKGEVSGLTNSAMYVVTSPNNATRVDTILSKDGKFEFVSSYDSVKPIIIYMEEGNVWITVWAQNGETIQIEGNAFFPELIETTGNEVNNLLTEFKQNNREIIRELSSLDREQCQKEDLEQKLLKEAEDFIKKHPASIASLVLIQDYLIENEDVEILGNYLSLIESPAKEDKLYARLKAVHYRLEQTLEGSIAPDFSLTDVKGDTISLDSLKDYYVVIAFENFSCKACKDDLPVLEKISKDYRKKKLAILNIIFDETNNVTGKKPTGKTAKWLQVVDKYGWASPLLTSYNVNMIPDYFVVDKESKIIASHASIDEVQQLLKEKLK
jgi:peroxiredoxin